MDSKIKETLQALREMAITELLLSNESFKNIFMKYISASTYNAIIGKKTTIQNIEKELESKKELRDLLKNYDLDINQRMLTIAMGYNK